VGFLVFSVLLVRWRICVAGFCEFVGLFVVGLVFVR